MLLASDPSDIVSVFDVTREFQSPGVQTGTEYCFCNQLSLEPLLTPCLLKF